MPNYYAVIFKSKLSENSVDYRKTAENLLNLAEEQDGFIEVESVRDNLDGITVS
jgi:heme-degrading monooxygenase HmoA